MKWSCTHTWPSWSSCIWVMPRIWHFFPQLRLFSRWSRACWSGCARKWAKIVKIQLKLMQNGEVVASRVVSQIQQWSKSHRRALCCVVHDENWVIPCFHCLADFEWKRGLRESPGESALCVQFLFNQLFLCVIWVQDDGENDEIREDVQFHETRTHEAVCSLGSGQNSPQLYSKVSKTFPRLSGQWPSAFTPGVVFPSRGESPHWPWTWLINVLIPTNKTANSYRKIRRHLYHLLIFFSREGNSPMKFSLMTVKIPYRASKCRFFWKISSHRQDYHFPHLFLFHLSKVIKMITGRLLTPPQEALAGAPNSSKIIFPALLYFFSHFSGYSHIHR